MRLTTKMAFVLLFMPLIASAQFKDLDGALSSLNRGFGGGDVQAIVAGIADGEQVMLQFPGLVEQSGGGFYGRDQAAYLLDGLFNKAEPVNFEQQNTKKASAEKQYHITARWTMKVGDRTETRDLYITLRDKNERWSIASVRSAGSR